MKFWICNLYRRINKKKKISKRVRSVIYTYIYYGFVGNKASNILRLLIFGLRVTVKAICDKSDMKYDVWRNENVQSRSVYHHNIW